MMTDTRKLIFYHAPNTRSTGTRILLEELNVEYELHALDFKAEAQRQPPYLAINPMGKVPAIKHGDTVITEQGAVFIYLADFFPAAGLAPALRDSLRGAYLRWIVFYGSCFEPALIDRAQKREPAPRSTSPYADYDTMLKTLTDNLERGPYMLGENFSAADVLWGTALGWTTNFGLVPRTPVVDAYIARVNARPAVARANALDAELGAALARGR